MLASLLLCSALAGPDAMGAVDTFIEAQRAALGATYTHLHRNPELSMFEEATSAFVAGRLRELGYEVTHPFGRYAHGGRAAFGVVGILKNGKGPRLLLRTDLDALPITEATKLPFASVVTTQDEAGATVGVMHACGHDAHMTVLLGTAQFLAAHRELWRGELVLVGQPAEEKGAGAAALFNAGLYERFGRPDFALALHMDATLAAGNLGSVEGYAMANVDSVDVTIKGRGGHGAYPHLTVDPVVLSAQLVLALQTLVSRTTSPLDPTVITVGSIHGGTKHNVIPDEVHLQLTVRSYTAEVRKTLLDGIDRLARATVQGAGLDPKTDALVRVDPAEFTPSLFNSPDLVRRLRPVLERALGAARVSNKQPVMGGEDFSRYSLDDHSVPAAMFWLGAVDPKVLAQHAKRGSQPPSLHSTLFTVDHARALPTGVSALTAAALELLAQ